MSKAPRVLYLTGMLRSGSTMLGNVLDTLPGVVHVGELHFLWLNGFLGTGSNSTCGCGDDLRSCEFWTELLRSAGVSAEVTAPGMVAAQRHHLRIRHLPRQLAGRPAGSGLHAAMDTTVALYRALARRVGSRLIVDSSKCPTEAAALLARDDLDVRVVHLVRDPRAVVCSYRTGKDYIEPMASHRVLGYWAAFNLASELLGARWPKRYLRVRYEDLTAAPRPVLAELSRFAGLPDEPIPVDDRGWIDLPTNHTVTGNPDRLRHGPTRIQPDERWRTALSPGERGLLTAVTTPLLARYGYLGRPPAAVRDVRVVPEPQRERSA